MPRSRIALLVIVAIALSLPLPRLAAFADEDSLDREDLAEKAFDLERAQAHGSESPDRIVVVYSRATPVGDPERAAVRGLSGARLLRADRALRVDVLRVPGGDAGAVAQRLRGLPGVLDAYPDRVASIIFTPNDPLFGQMWGLTKIQSPTAWDTARGRNVPVAILDCGIYKAHQDLGGKVTLEANFSTSGTTDDRCNHGTHVAGTVAAVTDNGIGVASVAPDATLYNGKVLGDNGGGFFSDVDRGIRWAATNGAKVVNMSLGADIPCPSGTQTAVNDAWSRGVVLVAAAGNSGASSAGAPANCTNVIGVAATDHNDAAASFTNVGKKVEVAAPGVSIISTVNPNLNRGTSYATLSGTSMASPHAAGVAALIWSTPLGTSNAAVRDRLFATCDAIPNTGSYYTYGRINAAKAVAPGTAPQITVSPTSVAAGASFTATWSGIATPTATDWIGLFPAGAPNTAYIAWRYTTGAASGSVPFTVPSGTVAGSYDVRLFANDGFTLLAATSISVVGAPAPTLSVSPTSVAAGASFTATWSGIATPTATDWIGLFPAGAPNTAYIAWRYTTGAASGSVPFTVPGGTAPGSYDVRLFANDGFGLLASTGVTVSP